MKPANILMTENEFRRAMWDQHPELFVNLTIEQCDKLLQDSFDKYMSDNDPLYRNPETYDIDNPVSTKIDLDLFDYKQLTLF